jgi:DNA mismatch repair protein MutL
MRPGIQPLPDDVICLIGAGEVIDSLAAAVRELVENALDAHATRLTVSVWPERWKIAITDNGDGMLLGDLKQAAQPHSTSKIRDCTDLQQIQSLGFRGEALHSLALLAELEILSCHQAEPDGWRVVYDPQGYAISAETAAIASGTIVTVSDLFVAWAARRQALPSPTQQLRAVQATIQKIALCHPWVTWQVRQNDRDWFSIWPGQAVQDILPQFLRDVHAHDLQTLTQDIPSPLIPGFDPPDPCQLQLTLGLPDRCHRYRPDWIRIAVNHRMLHIPELEQTIVASMRRVLPRDRFPVCLVHLHLPPRFVDWNRHPAKTEIYLHYLDYWQTQIEQAITQVLQLRPSTLPEQMHTQRVSKLLKAAEAQGEYLVSRAIQPASGSSEPAVKETGEQSLAPNVVDLGRDRDQVSDLQLQAVAQVHNTYILAEHPAGLWLVEQHIAHERVLYEQLCDRWQIVNLEQPIVLNKLTIAQQEQLERIGITVELFGDQVWVARTAPELLAQRDDCSDALIELSLGGDLQTAQVATACRSAIRNGTPLTLPEMQHLLYQWQRTRNPRTCPHGRPIFLSLAESSLARFFRRHWVIGKSHGI